MSSPKEDAAIQCLIDLSDVGFEHVLSTAKAVRDFRKWQGSKSECDTDGAILKWMCSSSCSASMCNHKIIKTFIEIVKGSLAGKAPRRKRLRMISSRSPGPSVPSSSPDVTRSKTTHQVQHVRNFSHGSFIRVWLSDEPDIGEFITLSLPEEQDSSFAYAEIISCGEHGVEIAWLYSDYDVAADTSDAQPDMGMMNPMYRSNHTQKFDGNAIDISNMIIPGRIGTDYGHIRIGGFYDVGSRNQTPTLETDEDRVDTRRLQAALRVCLTRGTSKAQQTMGFARGPWTKLDEKISGRCAACGTVRQLLYRNGTQCIGESCHEWMDLACSIQGELDVPSRCPRTVYALLDKFSDTVNRAARNKE